MGGQLHKGLQRGSPSNPEGCRKKAERGNRCNKGVRKTKIEG